MNKILRNSFVALMAMVGMNVSAQEVTIDFSGDTDNWGIGTTNVTEGKSYTYNGLTIKLTPGNGGNFHWYTSGNILLGKKDATFELPAFDFDVERIDVVGTSGASTAVKQNIFVGETAVSTETTGAKDVTNKYEIAADKQAAGNVYVLKVTSAHNTQITKILVWKKGTIPAETIPEVDNIEAFTALGNGTEAVLKLDKCKVTYVNDKYVYVRDNTGGMCFYNQSALAGATNKWQLGGQLKGKVSSYKGLTQMTVTDAEGMTHTDGEEYQPVEIGVADAKNHIADLVKITDKITVKEVSGKFYNNADKDLQIYDNFKLNYTIKDGDVIENLTGIIIPYNTQIEIAPTVAPSVSTGIDTVKAVEADNAPAYNLAGQQVNASYKGVVVKNGRKFIQK